MLSHAQIWSAIDALAEHNGVSASALARLAGLDPTSFNRSKRQSADGRLRWPSTESLSRVLNATQCSLQDFAGLAGSPIERIENAQGTQASQRTSHRATQQVPLLGFAQAGSGGYFDDGGYPTGHGWDMVELPAATTRHAYALKVQGESMQPLYRNGDTLIVDPESPVRKGDRVVVKTCEGEIMAKALRHMDAKTIELSSLNPDYPDRSFKTSEVEWIGRIVWASQ